MSSETSEIVLSTFIIRTKHHSYGVDSKTAYQIPLLSDEETEAWEKEGWNQVISLKDDRTDLEFRFPVTLGQKPRTVVESFIPWGTISLSP